MATMHNRVELAGIVDDAPQPVSPTLVRVRVRQGWTYVSKNQRREHVQRIYCVFLGDTVGVAQELHKGDNIWIVGQLIRRPRSDAEQANGAERKDSFTFEIHVLEAHVIARNAALKDNDPAQVPEQERTRRAVRATSLHPFFAECTYDWPI